MRADAQVLKGHLDMLLLATLENGPRHGYAVREALREASRTRFDLPTGTIYPALRRLEAAGLVQGRWSVEDGRRRPGRLGGLHLGSDRDLGTSIVPGHALISSYLSGLRRRLPAGLADEVSDGLLEASQYHLARGQGADAAARAAYLSAALSRA